ncbi:DNA N-6-adenine-methyltransferase [Halorubrum distributum]|uniref:C-5 cytosine-specific DNA methylase n=1 Tax=Halorubrum distributum JCM 13916 TaxID=1230455 RepID=M0PPL8_9EURY|nr:DNA N-6-adenine-methyltransferase [Halorubrum arcis]EMA71968.1 C-5 cytosine-specific DNA methylase [Halorubrum arcis JCM 13916]
MSLFSHEFHEDSSDEFGTPAEFHRPLADAVGGFDLDPASGAESQPLASTRFTKEDDGLSKEWFGTVWLNPPFSEKTRWVRKARAEVAEGNVETAVVLLPVDTSTKLFHDHVTDATAICFVEGRLSFDGGDRNPNFGTLLAVFGEASDDLLDALDRKGSVFRVDAKHERAEQQELVTDGGRDRDDDLKRIADALELQNALLLQLVQDRRRDAARNDPNPDHSASSDRTTATDVVDAYGDLYGGSVAGWEFDPVSDRVESMGDER